MEIVSFLFNITQTYVHYKNMSLKYIYKMPVTTKPASEKQKNCFQML